MHGLIDYGSGLLGVLLVMILLYMYAILIIYVCYSEVAFLPWCVDESTTGKVAPGAYLQSFFHPHLLGDKIVV